MEFRILGPLEVRADDGAVIAVTQPQQRSALALLLLRAGSPCSRDWLADAIWGEQLPRRADTALRTCIYGLRRALGENGSRVQTHPSGYLIQAAEGELDLFSWRSLHVQGLAALDRRDAAGAARLLWQALELWRDPPLDDLPATPSIAGETDRLLGQRQDARDALMDARLALGHHHAVIAELRGIVTEDPLREHAWAQLILAMYRCGLQAEAVAAYTRLRGVLAAELGVEPSPELQQLLTQILSGDRALTAPAPPPQPGGLPPPWIPVCQLPAEPADFTGRAAEAAELAGRMTGAAMTVTVIGGPPGGGKTALALHAAHCARPAFPDGQLFARLGGAAAPRDSQEVLAEMLRALGVPPEGVPLPGAEREAMYRSILAGRRVLVLLDDAADSAQVRPLLPGTAGAAVVVTSRSMSRLADLDGARPVEAGGLSPSDAAALLARVAGRADLPPAVAAAIAEHCDCLPLALRIVGARLAQHPGMPPAELAAALADPARRLGELTVGDLSVRDRIAVSYGALDEPSRAALVLLARHAPGDFAPWLPRVLAGGQAAARLAAVGLLTDAGGRYRLHSLVRAFAAGLPGAEGAAQEEADGERLSAAWLELADAADRHMPRQLHVPVPSRIERRAARFEPALRSPEEAAAWFAAERHGLMSVTLREAAAGRPAAAAGLAARQWSAQVSLALYGDAGDLWRAVAAAAAGDAPAEAAAVYRLCVLDAEQGRWERAERRLRGCLITFGLARDAAALADAQGLAARCAHARGDLPAALRRAQACLDAAYQAADPRLVSLGLSVLGTALAALGGGEEGSACCEEALEIASAEGDPAAWAMAEQSLRYARQGRAAGSAPPATLREAAGGTAG